MESIQGALDFLTKSKEGALATLNDGLPFVSVVGFFFEFQPGEKWGNVVLLLSDLAQHTKNIRQNPAVSLLAVEKSDLPVHEKRRLTIEGKVSAAAKDENEIYKKRYLEVFPKSGIFFTLSDFKFYELEISQIHWYGGFGKAAVFKRGQTPSGPKEGV